MVVCLSVRLDLNITTETNLSCSTHKQINLDEIRPSYIFSIYKTLYLGNIIFNIKESRPYDFNIEDP